MLIANYIDKITRLESALDADEQNSIFELLDTFDELYLLRRSNSFEKNFWNQFWHNWDYINLRNAYQQAFIDMAKDPYIHSRSHMFYKNAFRNFEKAVAADQFRFRNNLLALLIKKAPNLSSHLFYNRQASVQHCFTDNDLPEFVLNKTKHSSLNLLFHFTEEHRMSGSVTDLIKDAVEKTNLRFRRHRHKKRKKKRIVYN